MHAEAPACGSAMAHAGFRAAACATEQGGTIAASEWQDVGVVDGPHAGARGYGRPIDANADAAECGHVGDFWQVRPVGSIAAPTLMCRRTDLRVIPDRWLSEVRCGRYNRLAIMEQFQGPCLDAAVVPLSTFMRVHKLPTSSDVYSWWGRRTYLCMAEKLQSLLQHMRRKGELWHFQMAEWKCGVVYADGCKATQLLPRAATANSRGEQLGWQQWWPVILVQVDATRIVAFDKAGIDMTVFKPNHFAVIACMRI